MSPVDPDAPLSATVLCRRPGAPPGPPTAASLAEVVPDPAPVEALRRRFAEAGFATTEPVAGTFSITAPRQRWTTAFAAVDPDRFDDDRLARGTDADRELGPDAVAAAVGPVEGLDVVVAFSAPPDFGPGAP